MKNKGFSLVIAIVLFVAAVYVLTTPTITGFLTRTGEFTLGNEAINVTNIYLNDVECTDGVPTDCTITGVANTTKDVIVTVTVQDNNGNCDEFLYNNGTAYFCVGDVSPCTDNEDVHKVTDLEYAGEQWGDSNEYCNLTGTATSFYFFEVNGTYTVNVTVTDGVSSEEWTADFMYYNEIRGIEYPEASIETVSMGALALSSWNDGKGYHFVQNSGNIISDLAWNATDFTGGNYSDIFAIDGLNFLIDDDDNRTDDTSNIVFANISTTPTTTVNFFPASGLLNCSSVACSNTNATMDVYWHLDLPYGLHADVYTDTIEVSTSDHV